eukprot:Amastigsp_a176227_86.p1 type:complete len:287 gc:universal Amastigsp_a176227_86:1-861(+)
MGLGNKISVLYVVLTGLFVFLPILYAMAAAPASLWTSVVRASALHVSKPTWWLESRFHFNFAGWSGGPDSFGVLRVVNDDLVQPHSGFGTHGHTSMEIFSFVLHGYLSHADSMGSKETLGRGAVQYMSAGRGVRHSELNDRDEVVRFLQIWIEPTREGARCEPRYGSREYTRADRLNTLLPVIQNIHDPNADERSSRIHQDVNVITSELDGSSPVAYSLRPDRQMYLICAEGDLNVKIAGKADNIELHERDALKVKAPAAGAEIEFTSASPNSLLLFIEMARNGDV